MSPVRLLRGAARIVLAPVLPLRGQPFGLDDGAWLLFGTGVVVPSEAGFCGWLGVVALASATLASSTSGPRLLEGRPRRSRDDERISRLETVFE